MRILVDSLCCGIHMYGAGRMLLEHLRRLAGRGMDVHLVVSPDNRGLFEVPGVTHHLFPYPLRKRALSLPAQLLWERMALPRLVRWLRADAFLRPNLSMFSPLPCPQAAFVLDMAEFHPDGCLQYGPRRAWYRRVAVASNIRGADRVLTISAHAATEIEARYPAVRGGVGVIHCGPPDYEPPAARDARGGDGIYLAVGKQLLHKNHMLLCRAYVRRDREERIRRPLVFLGGSGNATDVMRAFVEREGYGDRILFKGYVSEEEMRDHFRRAVACLFPSFYEGFGLPILESQARGVPVVCSDASCLPEVAGGAAVLLDPRDEAGWARAIGDIEAGRTDLAALREAGYANVKRFSWDASAVELSSVLEALAVGRGRDGRRRPAAAMRGKG